MRKRTGDWRDLLSAYALALDAKKIYVGFIAALYTFVMMAAAASVYYVASVAGLVPASDASRALASLGDSWPQHLIAPVANGTGMQMLCTFLVLLNPFHSNLAHFVLSVLFYLALFWAWSGTGGIISRLVALEYARDDLPTLTEARSMVRARRRAYFMAPLMPLVVIVFLSGLNMLGGLVGSGWYIGKLLLIFPGFPLLTASTLIIVFLIVFGLLSFGLMMPAVSVGGKDAFESWTAAYSYVLWGLRRFIGYSVVAGLIGVIAVIVAWALTELLIYLICQTVSIGYVSPTPWIIYHAGVTEGRLAITIGPANQGFACVLSSILVALMLLLRALPVGYAFSYFFTANTIMFFLLRKDQDNVDIEELFEEAPEEDEAGAAAEAPGAESGAAGGAPGGSQGEQRGEGGEPSDEGISE
jgi:hypothetical protein